jgi:aspartate/methionine/tyrosine aminotransferase
MNAFGVNATIAADTRAKALAERDVDFINLAAGEPRWNRPESVADGARSSSETLDSKYGKVRGLPDLIAAIERRMHLLSSRAR